MDKPASLDDARDPLIIAEGWMAEGRGVALATVIETWGSAPNPVGSQLVIDGAGNFQGSVSGGCIEGAVVTAAAEAIGTGAARIEEFGVADETAWRVGLSCGGRIKVHVEPLDRGGHMDAALLKALNDERRARRAALVVTDLDGGGARLVREDDKAGGTVGEAFARALRTGSSFAVEADGKRLFVNTHLPQPRFVVIGAVHISQALAPMARVAGYPIEIIDPRTAFASAERFPDVDLRAEWPDAVLAERPLDAYCAVAAITHDPKIDDVALKAALDAGCFYVGALGSRKTHAKRMERLLAMGVSPDDIARIAAPIGLDIGAANPAEIAVSILAQMVRAFRSRGMNGEPAPKGEPA